MIVEVNNLVKKYKNGVVALNGINLEVREGEIFGLLGPNGSGKTTCINCILSLLKYDSGTINVFDKKMMSTSYDLKKDIGVIMQNVAVFDELTVYENIDFFCGLYIKDKNTRKEYVDWAIKFVSLEDYVKFKPKKLSGGLLRRLHIACGIAHKPKLIILDEPTVAVDPQSRNKILEGIKELNKMGSTIIYTSHYMEEIEELCSYIVILDKGHVLAHGTKEKLKDMVSKGEKIKVELQGNSKTIIEKVLKIPGVVDAEVNENILSIKTDNEKTLIHEVIDLLNEEKVSYNRINSEKPSLNDVFLDLTGRELRD